VLHRVVVYVINVAGEIPIVANCMLPIAPLPKRKLPIRVTLEIYAISKQPRTEMPLYPTPTPGEIRITVG